MGCVAGPLAATFAVATLCSVEAQKPPATPVGEGRATGTEPREAAREARDAARTAAGTVDDAVSDPSHEFAEAMAKRPSDARAAARAEEKIVLANAAILTGATASKHRADAAAGRSGRAMGRAALRTDEAVRGSVRGGIAATGRAGIVSPEALVRAAWAATRAARAADLADRRTSEGRHEPTATAGLAT
jgi:hypothetical protein